MPAAFMGSRMVGGTDKNSGFPDWYAEGIGRIWLPYAQMKTVSPPLPVVSTDGARIRLADGRELIDGIASWWTACHGYNQPHIRQAVERQLGANAACDVRRAGPRAGFEAGAPAGRVAAGRFDARVLFQTRDRSPSRSP